MSRRKFILSSLFAFWGLESVSKGETNASKNKVSNNKDELSDIKAALKELQQKVANLDSSKVPLGTIMSYAGDIENTPDLKKYWLPCDGRELSRENEYKFLFQAIGTLWGEGNGNTTFNLPDLQGQFLRGVQGKTGRDKGAGKRFNLERLLDPSKTKGKGNLDSVVGSYQECATQMPTGGSPFKTNENGEHNHGCPTFSGEYRPIGGPYEVPREGSTSYDYIGAALTSKNGSHDHTITGGGDPETRPINAAILWIIKVKQEV